MKFEKPQDVIFWDQHEIMWRLVIFQISSLLFNRFV